MNRKELEKLTCEVRLGAAKLATTGNKAALVERLYQHLRDPSSETEPEREGVPDATPESEDSSESTAKKRVESILDFQLIYHLHSGTKCLHTWYKPLTICKWQIN